jgi:hypothetical protein
MTVSTEETSSGPAGPPDNVEVRAIAAERLTQGVGKVV